MIESVRVIVRRAGTENLDFSFITQEAEDLLDSKLDDWMGAPKFWQSRIHPEDLSSVLQCCRRVIKQGKPEKLNTG